MITDQNYRFWTNISLDGYKKKSDASACLTRKGAKNVGMETMSFYCAQVNIKDFLWLAVNGHTFCNLFDYETDKEYWFENAYGFKFKTSPVYTTGRRGGCMKLLMKSDRFFYGTQTIFVDIDYTRFTNILEYLSVLTIPPSCVYMSYSDNIEKHGVVSRRFRMVYVFDSILDREATIGISKYIHKTIEQDTGELMEDDCGTRISQYMNGVYGNMECYQSNFIYSVSDFPTSQIVMNNNISVTPQTNNNAVNIEFDNNLLRDMGSMSYEEFMHRYSWKYKYFYRIERPDWIDGKYQLTDENYLQLWWHSEKLVDGQNRRNTLYKRVCLRRIMYPDVDPDTLLFNAYVDLVKFIDNSDSVIQLDTLKNKVIGAFSRTIEELREYCAYEIQYWKEHRFKFITHPDFSDQASINVINKEIRYREIDKIYDRSKSTMENLAKLDVPQTTLYRYCNDRQINTRPQKGLTKEEERSLKRIEKQEKVELFKSLYAPDKSESQNLEIMRQNGLEMSVGNLHNWKKKYLNVSAQPLQEETELYNSFNFQLPKINIPQMPKFEQNYPRRDKPKFTNDRFLSDVYGIPMYDSPPIDDNQRLGDCWGDIIKNIPPAQDL